MAFLMSFICFCVAILALVMIRYFLNPITVMFLIWSILLPISQMGFYNVNVPSAKAYLIIGIGLAAYFLGAILGLNKVKFTWGRNGAHEADRHKVEVTYRINYRVLYVLYGITIIYFISQIAIVLTLLRAGYAFDYIRRLVSMDSENVIRSSSWINGVRSFIATPITYLSIAILPFELLKKKKNRIIIIQTIIMLVCWVLTTAGRSILMWFPLYFICVYTMKGKRLKYTREWRRMIRKYRPYIILGGAAIVVFFFSITFSRKGNDVDLIREAFIYFVAPLAHFDLRLKTIDMQYSSLYGFGASSFYGVLYPIFYIIKFFRGEHLDFVLKMHDLSFASLEKSVLIGKHFTMNAFVTAFYQPYLDGRYIGVIIILCIFGYMCSKTFYKARYLKDERSMLLYSLLLQKIVFSMVRFYFTQASQAICFIFAIFIMHKHIRVLKDDTLDTDITN